MTSSVPRADPPYGGKPSSRSHAIDSPPMERKVIGLRLQRSAASAVLTTVWTRRVNPGHRDGWTGSSGLIRWPVVDSPGLAKPLEKRTVAAVRGPTKGPGRPGRHRGILCVSCRPGTRWRVAEAGCRARALRSLQACEAQPDTAGHCLPPLHACRMGQLPFPLPASPRHPVRGI